MISIFYVIVMQMINMKMIGLWKIVNFILKFKAFHFIQLVAQSSKPFQNLGAALIVQQNLSQSKNLPLLIVWANV